MANPKMRQVSSTKQVTSTAYSMRVIIIITNFSTSPTVWVHLCAYLTLKDSWCCRSKSISRVCRNSHRISWHRRKRTNSSSQFHYIIRWTASQRIGYRAMANSWSVCNWLAASFKPRSILNNTYFKGSKIKGEQVMRESQTITPKNCFWCSREDNWSKHS